MSHNLTQPEEIDRIFDAMTGQGRKADVTNCDGIQAGGIARNVGHDKLVTTRYFQYGGAHKKSAHGTSDQ